MQQNRCVLFCVRFQKCVLPEGLAKELLQIMHIPKYSELIDYAMVLLIATCKFDAKNITDVFKHVPDQF